jgi:hypothetical protein
MSVLCKNWRPTETDRESVASMPLDKELTLAVSMSRPDGLGVSPYEKRVLILSANVDDVVLFGLRFWEGSLRLNAGIGEGQHSQPLVYGADHFDFQVSFNPSQGGLAIVASWVLPSGERASHAFAANISNLKLPKARYYTLRFGAPKHYVDHAPMGWRINATFDLAAPVTEFPSDMLEFVPTAPQALPMQHLRHEEEMLANLFLGYDPTTERLVHREPGRLVVEPLDPVIPIVDGEPAESWRAQEGPLPLPFVSTPGRVTSALVEADPHETLRIALQSIGFWREAAEQALQALEGGVK